MKRFFSFFIGQFTKKAMSLGKVLNQNPSKEENLKAKKRAQKIFLNMNDKKKIPVEKNQKIRDIYSHKGSGYKGKGNINTDSSVFNKPRKDIPTGKQH